MGNSNFLNTFLWVWFSEAKRHESFKFPEKMCLMWADSFFIEFNVCLHVTSGSPSKFNIVSMVMVTLMDRMGLEHICSIWLRIAWYSVKTITLCQRNHGWREHWVHCHYVWRDLNIYVTLLLDLFHPSRRLSNTLLHVSILYFNIERERTRWISTTLHKAQVPQVPSNLSSAKGKPAPTGARLKSPTSSPKTETGRPTSARGQLRSVVVKPTPIRFVYLPLVFF